VLAKAEEEEEESREENVEEIYAVRERNWEL